MRVCASRAWQRRRCPCSPHQHGAQPPQVLQQEQQDEQEGVQCPGEAVEEQRPGAPCSAPVPPLLPWLQGKTGSPYPMRVHHGAVLPCCAAATLAAAPKRPLRRVQILCCWGLGRSGAGSWGLLCHKPHPWWPPWPRSGPQNHAWKPPGQSFFSQPRFLCCQKAPWGLQATG